MQSKKEHVLEVFKKFLWPESKQRSRLGVHVLGKQYTQELQEATTDVFVVKDPEILRASLSQYAVPTQ